MPMAPPRLTAVPSAPGAMPPPTLSSGAPLTPAPHASSTVHASQAAPTPKSELGARTSMIHAFIATPRSAAVPTPLLRAANYRAPSKLAATRSAAPR
mmetsp:Transcript_71874/g.119058  ORF Transcript_71874/g.119058 Transcript_71874/m.119058 type:complete len:97 (+) Transcript_71874:309-599(+)